MSFQIYQPADELRPFIKSYWSMQSCAHANSDHYQRIVPNGLAELTFYFGTVPEYQRSGKSTVSNGILSGQNSGYYDIRVTGNLDMLSVLFTPNGARVFFDFPMTEISNLSLPIDLLDKKPTNELYIKLSDVQEPLGRVRIVESYFLRRLKNIHTLSLSRMQNTIHQLKVAKGMLDISTLADSACLSAKQYKRVFKDWIGIGPKAFSRVVRFQHAVYLMQINSPQSLTELAYAAGYYDQAHMIQDFKMLSGMTPRQYFSDCLPYSDLYAE